MENEKSNELPAEEKKPVIPLREAVFAWCAFALGFVFTHFCVSYFGGLWGGLFWAVFGALTAVYAKMNGIRFTKFQWVMFGTAELFCLTPIFCANRELCFLAAVFSFVLYFYLMLCVSGAESFGRHFVLDLVNSLLMRPLANFTQQPVCAFSVFKDKKHSKNALYAVFGLLLAVPLTIVVAAMLISSDEVFGDMMRSFSDNLSMLSFSLVWELLFAAPIAMYLFGAQYSLRDTAPEYRKDASEYRLLPTVTVYFAVSPICIFYLIYVIVQCGNITNVLGGSGDIRYSDFARQGFFELCAIAVINLGVIVFALTFSKRRKDDVKPLALRVYAIIISVFTLMIIATALVKMFMYIGEFGMTQLRIYTSWFMILLAFVFAVILISQIREFVVWKALFAGFVLMFGLLCFGNFDGNMAAYNINAYKSGALSELDVNDFDKLGFAAAAPAEALLSECEDEYLSRKLAEFLERQHECDSSEDEFAYFSLPRVFAKSAYERAGDKINKSL